MKTNFILIFSLIFYQIAFCSDCKTISKSEEYDQSDYIFSGVVTDIKDDYFEIKVIELFKGNLKEISQNKFRVTINHNSVLPKKRDMWLFYSKKLNNKYFVSSCGWTRNFDNPLNSNSIFFPAPPPSGISNSILNLLNNFNKKIALLELRNDILSLKQIKTHKEIIKVKEENLKINRDKLFELKIYKWFFFTFILLAILLSIYYFRNRKSDGADL